MFADISGFTAMTEQRDAEQVVILVNACLAHLSECVYRYDGTIDKYIGDAIMAVFGAPRTHEDDPERAVRAALDMHEALEAFKSNAPLPLTGPLDIHIGVSTGYVIAGMIGTERHQDYTVMGDAANLAARLQDLAERGQIFVSEDTYRLTSQLFLFRELEPTTIKGKSEPIQIYEVVGAARRPGSMRGLVGSDYPLVGRHTELHALSLAITNLRHGQGGITLIEGDAGIGKSRLVTEVRNHMESISPNFHWLEGRGLSYGHSRSYHLLASMLRDYLGLSDEDDETLAWCRLQAASTDLFGARADDASPYLGILLGLRLPDDVVRRIPQANPNLLRQRVFTTFGEWAMAVAKRKPLVLAFDDLHWADPNSMTLIEYLMTLCADNPLLVLCVSRPDRESPFWQVREKAIDMYPDSFIHITLGPMPDNEILTLINSLLNLDYLPSEIEYVILSRAEGNPLFVEEMLRNFIEDGTLAEEDGIWRATWPLKRAEVPDTLQGMLIARLDRLDDSTKRTVQIAAVIGRAFSKSVLERVVDNPSVLNDGLIELQRAEIIRHRSPEPDPEYIFKHMLTQEAAYQSLLTQQRRIYHQQVADALARIFWERGEEYAGAGLVADHYERAERWPRVLRYLERAGDGARAVFDNNAAVDYYTRALKVADSTGIDATPAQRLVLHEKRGALLASLDDIDSALADYEQVPRLAQMIGDRKAKLRTLNQIGALQSGLGHVVQAGEYFKQALILAEESGDPAGVADSLNRLGEYYRNSADYQEAAAHHQQALEIARSTGDNWLLAASMEGLGEVDLARDDLNASLDKWSQVVALRRRLADPLGLMKALNALAMLYTWRGEYERVADVGLEAFEFISRVGDLPVVSSLHTYFAISHLIRGHLATVAEHLLAALEVARRLDHRVMKTHSLVWLAYYYAAIGQIDVALQSSEESVSLASRSTSPRCQVRAAACLGAVHLEKGSIDHAFHILTDVYDHACQLDSAPDKAEALYELGHANLALANWEATEGLVGQLLSLADACELGEYQARGRWLRGRLFLAKEDVSGALESLENARQRAESMGAHLILWKICAATGDAHRAADHGDQAGRAYRRSWEMLQSMATTLPTQATRDSMLASPPANALRAKIEASS